MEREAVSLCIPADLLQQAKQFIESSESFNEMVVDAITREVRRQPVLAAHQRIVARSAEVEIRLSRLNSSVTRRLGKA